MKLSEIIGKKIAVHCPTEPEAEQVLAIMKTSERLSKDALSKNEDNWYSHQNDTCYDIHCGFIDYCTKTFYTSNGYTIIPASEFIASNQPEKVEPENPKRNPFNLNDTNSAVYFTAYVMACSAGTDPEQADARAWNAVDYLTEKYGK